jgi:hypothetical protein
MVCNAVFACKVAICPSAVVKPPWTIPSVPANVVIWVCWAALAVINPAIEVPFVAIIAELTSPCNFTSSIWSCKFDTLELTEELVAYEFNVFVNVVGYLTLQGNSYTIRYNPIPNVTKSTRQHFLRV